jgi:hypothetical protein
MPTTEAAGPLTLQECADELRIPLSILRRHIRAGTLVALALSPSADPGRRGPKCYRVERAEWERFKRDVRTKAAMPAPAEGETTTIPRGRPRTGEDRGGFGLLGNYRDRGTR